MQYRDLNNEIKTLKNAIKKIESTDTVSDKVQASNIEYPYQAISVTIYGKSELTKEEKEIRSKLLNQLHKSIELRSDIEDFIESIDDSRTRMIFRLRYIENWSWIKISRFLGSSNESYARVIHDRFLRRYTKCLDT